MASDGDEERQHPARGLIGARILVTGATGFIGAALVERLSEAGCELHCIARRPPDEGTSRVGQATWWNADITESDTIGRVVRAVRPDYVFHLASLVTGARELEMVEPLFRAECAATVGLLEALAQVGCRRVVCSGSMEQPDGPLEEVIIGSPYAAAKSASRAYQKLFDQLYGLPVVNARIAMAYGPGQRDASKLVPYVTRSFLAGTAPRLTDGSREADWTYIDDVVDAVICLATVDGARGQAIEIGTGTLTSVREVVEHLKFQTKASVDPEFGALPPRPLEQAPRADAHRTLRLTGWQASIGLEDGLRRTVEAYAAAESAKSEQ